MDKFKRERIQLRRLFTVSFNQVQEQLKQKPVIRDELMPVYKVFEDKANRLFQVDNSLKDAWLDTEDFDEEEFEKDFDSTEAYRNQWITTKNEYEELFSSKEINPSNVDQTNVSSELNSGKRHFRLPKLELKRFNGEIKNWLGFWGQFKKINDDESIDDEDKFQYLIQATEAGTVARELIESFPPSGSNYFKAIEQLKSRFARDELLIEIYVRELLNLVLAQVTKDDMSLSVLYDKLETQLRALETLGVTTEKYASMLYPLVESALPVETLRAWERSRTKVAETNEKTDHLTTLLQFLRLEVESEERLQIARSGFACSKNSSFGVAENRRSINKVPTASCIFSGEIKGRENACVWCEKTSHNASECFKIRNLSFDDKKELLRKKGGCYVCIKIGHNAKKCKSTVKCLVCFKRHATVMCPKLPQFLSQKGSEFKETNEDTKVLLTHRSGTTLLQTILVRILHDGKPRLVRVLFDNGAQRSYIRSDIPDRLNLKPSGEETLSHGLFGGAETTQKTHKVYDVTLQSLDGKFQYTMSVLDEEKICSYVPRIENPKLYPLLKQKKIILSDTGEDAPEIGLLIGADFSGLLMTGSIVHLNENLIAIETALGWTVQGPEVSSKKSLGNMACHCNLDLTDLWNLETIGIRDPVDVKSKEIEDAEVIDFFKQTVKVNEENRYEVCLPFKEGHPDLGDNKELAEKRLISTTKRLLHIGYMNEYDEIFKEWFQTGIIELVTNHEVAGHYLPHQAVIKNSSLTTKVRPVFDASAKDSKGNSLNSCLEKGLNFVELIPKLLILFRRNAIGIISDIKRAFLQISLSSDDRDFLRFLWWKDMNREEIITLRHCRVVFGVSPSPFLLGATIAYHLDQAPEEMRKTALQLKQSFYVDNCVTSLETKEEVNRFIDESKKLMASAQFDLRGWIISSEDTVENQIQNPVPVLGMFWNSRTDELYCNVNTVSLSQSKVTKRTLLSVAQRIFDPIGLTCPTSLLPKLILQRAWSMKCGWDEELPVEMRKEFQTWLEQVHLLNSCRIPRRISAIAFDDCVKSLHIFCDASKLSYAACIFLRTAYETKASVRLLMGKSRIAPIKQITIPRLELMAALIATRLYVQVKEALDLSSCKICFWSDSTVALTWIKRKSDWNTFVGNRVKEIRQYTDPEDWYHIPGAINPADLLSRGCDAKTLLKSQWWEGPLWLKSEPHDWPIAEIIASESEVNVEKRNTVVSSVSCAASNFTLNLTYFSQFSKIVRMIAWMLRFVNNCRYPKNMKKGELTSEEVLIAERKLFSSIQEDCLRGKEVKVMKEMQTFKDDGGLIRIRTKLVLGNEDEDFKCPILLPGDNVIIRRLVHQKHCQLLHAGLGTLLSNLRESYWIVGIRKLAKEISSNCIICKRYKAKAIDPPFAPLPRDRIKYASVFEVTGIDLAGPLILLSGEKIWIVLFTCAIYRAIHLEITKSLSTESFIMTLRRFIARRGRVSVIYTDNGTNFVGTNNALQGLDWDKIMSFSTVQKIKWKFNPPTAAWWGGWWERLVRMVKEILRRILGNATVTYEELETILCDCEATINSRPLTYIEDDADGLKPLTPARFMQCIPHSEVTDLDTIDSNSLNRRLRYIQKLRNDLRMRFRNEYLSMLVHRGRRREETLQVGDIVLIGGNEKRFKWPLGIIQEIFPGQDGHSRVARIKTADGEKVRPFQRLYPLEITKTDDILNTTHTSPLCTPSDSSEIPCEQFVDTEEKSNDKNVIASTNKDTDMPELPRTTFTKVGRQVKVPKRLDL